MKLFSLRTVFTQSSVYVESSPRGCKAMEASSGRRQAGCSDGRVCPGQSVQIENMQIAEGACVGRVYEEKQRISN